jgi:carbon-monoxide dehydrogenase medium subunit
MKPAAFAYHAPTSQDAVIALLARHGEDAKILAGGQSLVAAMNFRLARPAILIDVNRVPGLDAIRTDATHLHIGALSRHARFENPVTDGPLGRLLPQVAACIAHTPIRTRGTFGGSLAHADPASEWCALALALNAQIVTQGPDGMRVIPAEDFFITIFTTALRPDELLTEIRLPHLDASWRCGFAEYSRRAGDFALALAVVALRLHRGVIAEARIGFGGIASTPVASPEAAAILLGQAPSEALWAAAAEAASAAADPPGDIHGSAEYRRSLVGAMLRRALRQAVA